MSPRGLQVEKHRTPLELVPLLATIGTQPQLPPATLLCCGEVCDPYFHGFRLCPKTAKRVEQGALRRSQRRLSRRVAIAMSASRERLSSRHVNSI